MKIEGKQLKRIAIGAACIFASCIALILLRYAAWKGGFQLAPWAGYLAASIALVASIAWWVRPPLLGILAAFAAIYGIWKLAWIDAILARDEFKSICQQRAGIHIYKQLEIPAEYFDENGGFTFLDRASERVLVEKLPPGVHFEKLHKVPVDSTYTAFHEIREAISYGAPLTVVAEQVMLTASGGGPPRPVEGGALDNSPCPPQIKPLEEFMKQVFIPESDGEGK
jgi:hypothetical protein